MDIPHFIHSSVNENLGFPFLAVMNNAAMSICAQIFEWLYIFIFLGYIRNSEISGSCGYSYV